MAGLLAIYNCYKAAGFAVSRTLAFMRVDYIPHDSTPTSGSAIIGCGGEDSNLRSLGYEPSKMPLLYPAIIFGSPTWTRTRDILINSQTLLPTELSGNNLYLIFITHFLQAVNSFLKIFTQVSILPTMGVCPDYGWIDRNRTCYKFVAVTNLFY